MAAAAAETTLAAAAVATEATMTDDDDNAAAEQTAATHRWLQEFEWANVCDTYDAYVLGLPRRYELCLCSWVPYLWSPPRLRVSSCYRFFVAMLAYVDWLAMWGDVAPKYRGRRFLAEFLPENRRPVIPHPQVLALMKRPQEVQMSDAWFAARKPSCHLTASTMRTIFMPQPGRPYACADGVFRAKTANPSPPVALTTGIGGGGGNYDNAPCRHGRIHEKVANVLYEETEGTLVCAVGLLEHPEHPFLAASPDGVRLDVPVAVEYKCPFRREDIGLLHTYWYQCQLQAQCMACVYTTHLFLFWTDSYAPPRTAAWEYHVIGRDDHWFAHTALPVLRELWDRIQDCLRARLQQQQLLLCPATTAPLVYASTKLPSPLPSPLPSSVSAATNKRGVAAAAAAAAGGDNEATGDSGGADSAQESTNVRCGGGGGEKRRRLRLLPQQQEEQKPPEMEDRSLPAFVELAPYNWARFDAAPAD